MVMNWMVNVAARGVDGLVVVVIVCVAFSCHTLVQLGG